MVIRPALKKDLIECERLIKIPELKDAEGKFEDAEFIKGYLDKDYFLVAEEGKKVIAVAIGEKLKSRVAVLWHFTVRKDKRNKGIGKRLLKEFEKNCKEDRIRWLTIYAPTSNNKAVKFYKIHGYTKGRSFFEFEKIL